MMELSILRKHYLKSKIHMLFILTGVLEIDALPTYRMFNYTLGLSNAVEVVSSTYVVAATAAAVTKPTQRY